MHQYQLNIDRLRIRMIETTKEESCIREAIGGKRNYYNELKSKVEKEHKA